MLSSFLVVLGFILFILTLPGTCELLLLTSGAFLSYWFPQKIVKIPQLTLLKIVAIIPAHNEEKHISHTIKSLQAGGFLEDVWVIADNCTDDTANAAKKAGAHVLIRTDQELKGKPYALNYALKELADKNYDVFLIVDADTVVTQNLKEEVERLFHSGADAAQSLHGLFNPEPTMRTRFLSLAFAAFNHVRPLGREYWRLSAGILGNGFAFSRSTLEKVPFDPSSIVEDIEYHLKLVKAGLKVHYTDLARVYSDIPPAMKAAESQRARWEGGRLRMLLDYGPSLLKNILRGNFRLIEPLLDLCLLPLSYHVLLILILLFVPNAFLFDYALLSLFVLLFHGITTLLITQANWKDIQSILMAPFYIIWKVGIISKIIQGAGKGFGWKRTDR